jgi:hypothetical protein
VKYRRLILALLVVKAIVLAAIFAGRIQTRAASSAAEAAAFTSTNPLCSAPGVITCVGFDNLADIAGKDGDISGIEPGDQNNPQIDFTVKASGNGSLKFTIPSNATPNSSGSYFTNFSRNLATQFGESSEFYVQWSQRFSAEFLSRENVTGDGWKQAIIGTGDQPRKLYYTCTALEVVTQNEFHRGFAQMYNSCTGSSSHASFDDFFERLKTGDIKLQNARPSPSCLYSQSRTDPVTLFPPAGNCLAYFPDEWMRFQVHIKTGPRMNDEFTNSYIQLWIGREGQPLQPAIDWGPYNLTAGDPKTNQRFGKVWLIPYNSKRDFKVTRPTAYTWYDDLIVSTQPIGDLSAARGAGKSAR